MSSHATTSPTTAPPARAPGAVRAATVVLVVMAAVLGAVTLLVLAVSVAGALSRAGVAGVDPARQAGRLVGGLLVLAVPAAPTVLAARAALAVRARRSWPRRALTALAWVGGLLVAGALVLTTWWSLRTGISVSGVLMTIILGAPSVVALALPVSAAVLLRRPSARAWCDDLRPGLRR